MGEIDLAYLAGYFDADGCIIAGINHRRYLNVRVVARIMCRNVELLESLADRYGGCLTESQTGPGYSAWVWVATGKTAQPFLSDIQPYLRYKAEQCKLALEIIDTLGSVGVKVPLATKLKRRKLALRICELNQFNLSIPAETDTIVRLRALISDAEETLEEVGGIRG